MPRLGRIAMSHGESDRAIYVYTSEERVRSEVAHNGDYRRAVEDAYGHVKFCVLSFCLSPEDCVTSAGENEDTLRIISPVAPCRILVLDTNLHQLSPEEYERLHRVECAREARHSNLQYTYYTIV